MLPVRNTPELRSLHAAAPPVQSEYPAERRAEVHLWTIASIYPPSPVQTGVYLVFASNDLLFAVARRSMRVSTLKLRLQRANSVDSRAPVIASWPPRVHHDSSLDRLLLLLVVVLRVMMMVMLVVAMLLRLIVWTQRSADGFEQRPMSHAVRVRQARSCRRHGASRRCAWTSTASSTSVHVERLERNSVVL